jgi:hypothetical protein
MTGWLEHGPTSQPSGARRDWSQARRWLQAGGWLLPWLAILLVSAGCACAMNLALTGAWVPLAARSEPARALAGLDLPPAGPVGQGDDAQVVDRACVCRSSARTTDGYSMVVVGVGVVLEWRRRVRPETCPLRRPRMERKETGRGTEDHRPVMADGGSVTLSWNDLGPVEQKKVGSDDQSAR